MSGSSLSRTLLCRAARNQVAQPRLLSTTSTLKAEKDGIHGSGDTKKNTPIDGPMYTASGMRHKTDNEKQREEAVRGTSEVGKELYLLDQSKHTDFS